ncbi:MAG: ribonuclease HII [Halobacteria archaeon]|nr:ribonuclease HII [Halobacteria archaeon]
MIGVDEAGKGAVLGNMIVVALGIGTDGDGSIDSELRDSKKLSPARRVEIAQELRERARFSVVEIPPGEIDSYLETPDESMNDLMVEAHSRALNRIDTREGERVIVDASDVSAERFARRVSSKLDFEIEAEHGADDSYEAVSGASILAKVERDSHIRSIHPDAGSGYPSDPKTREFIRRNVRETGELPSEARKTWQTCRDILAEQKQSEIGDF